MASQHDIERKVSTASHESNLGKVQDSVDRHLAVHVPASLAGLTEAELEPLDKTVTKKVDLLLLPGLILLFVLNFLDRQNISSAKIGGMVEDLGLKGQQFNVCVSILFVGYSEYSFCCWYLGLLELLGLPKPVLRITSVQLALR
jgi:hypothetical protein